MADDNKLQFILDLDIKEFTEKILHAKGSIQEIGSKENLTELLEGLTSVGIGLAAAGVAAFAFKEAIDLTLEAEQIQKVNTQFELLTKNAGISSEELKTGLEEASKGLIDNTELLKIANQSIVTMGGSAKRLPEIMELARKATSVFGGDLKSNFENISQAISVGNTRMLKHYGIVVDSEKATKQYAKSIGIASNELSESGKRQAILNEVLLNGKKNFKDMGDGIGTATNSIQLMKTAWAEIKEIVILALEKVIGPLIRSFLGYLKDAVVATKDFLKSWSGDEHKNTLDSISKIEDKLKNLRIELSKAQEIQKNQKFDIFGGTASRIQNVTAEIKKYEAELSKLKAKNSEIEASEKSLADEREANAKKFSPEKDAVNLIKKLENEKKYQGEVLKLEKELFDAESLNIDSISKTDAMASQLRTQIEKENAQKILQIRNNESLNDRQKNALILQQNKVLQAQLQSLETKTFQLRTKLIQNYANYNQQEFKAIIRGFQSVAEQAKQEFFNMSKWGQDAAHAMQNHFTNAFEQMGAAMHKSGLSAKSAAALIKAAFLNSLADIAIQKGSALMLMGVGDLNPVEVGAGVGLIALGGYLKSVASDLTAEASSSSTPTVSTGGGGGASISAGGPSATVSQGGDGGGGGGGAGEAMPGMAAQQQARPQRSVHINIQGHYLDTPGSRRALMEMMRQETDATDFTYNKIGA